SIKATGWAGLTSLGSLTAQFCFDVGSDWRGFIQKQFNLHIFSVKLHRNVSNSVQATRKDTIW
uniref:Uncharacterized protein n=1 Tax=Anopheles atroparvus TaxID=41427 RepID=A0AAG5DPD9_ANOAO